MGGEICFLSSLSFLLLPPFTTSDFLLFQLSLTRAILMPPFLDILDYSLLEHRSLHLISCLRFPVAFLWDSLLEIILSNFTLLS